jgi:hypothetical protein
MAFLVSLDLGFRVSKIQGNTGAKRSTDSDAEAQWGRELTSWEAAARASMVGHVDIQRSKYSTTVATRVC